MLADNVNNNNCKGHVNGQPMKRVCAACAILANQKLGIPYLVHNIYEICPEESETATAEQQGSPKELGVLLRSSSETHTAYSDICESSPPSHAQLTHGS